MEARGNLAKICEYVKGELCCDIGGFDSITHLNAFWREIDM